jgi:hypothetical protein
MTPIFSDPAARRNWDAYFAEVDRILAKASADAESICEDLERHVIDSVAAQGSGGTEADRLNTALIRLGRPMDYLRPLIADDLLDRGTRTYRPSLIVRGLFHAVLAGSTRATIAVTFAIGYLLVGAFSVMAVLKPFWGSNVGLFRGADGSLSAGLVAHTNGAHELLGWWSIPISMAVAAILYVALTSSLRSLRTRR